MCPKLILIDVILVSLTHFMLMVSFNTPENISGGIERDQWHEIG